jgi:short-subunit dehydrogenase
MSRLALVTGSSSGIGQAYAERLARDRFDLVIVARRRDRLDELAARLTEEHGVAVEALTADLADVEHVQRLCQRVAELPVALLVNNAALGLYKPFVELDPSDAQALVQLNVLSPVLLTRAVLPGMVERGAGTVISIASLLAFSGAWEGPHLPQRAVYASSKSFLVTFTQVLAAELSGTGVRVQVVCPGIVSTEFHSRQGMDLSAVPRMAAEDVVSASMLDLERGVVVSIPGAPDEAVFKAVVVAQGELFGLTRTVALPDRYAGS